MKAQPLRGARVTDSTETGGGFTEAELDEICGSLSRLGAVDKSVLKTLGHANSNRGKRRALALLLGHQSSVRRCYVDSLRASCEREGLLVSRGDKANFSQDLKKDAERGLWTLATRRDGRALAGHIVLTDKGAELAARYAHLVDTDDIRARVQETAKAIHKSITIVAKTARCPLCLDSLEDVSAEDILSCSGCGSQAHADCLAGRGSHYDDTSVRLRCVLAQTTARCRGRYVRADGSTPTDESLDALIESTKDAASACGHCKGRGFTFHRSRQSCLMSPRELARLSPEERAHAAEPCRHAEAQGIGSRVSNDGEWREAGSACVHHSAVGGTAPCEYCQPSEPEPEEGAVLDGIGRIEPVTTHAPARARIVINLGDRPSTPPARPAVHSTPCVTCGRDLWGPEAPASPFCSLACEREAIPTTTTTTN